MTDTPALALTDLFSERQLKEFEKTRVICRKELDNYHLLLPGGGPFTQCEPYWDGELKHCPYGPTDKRLCTICVIQEGCPTRPEEPT